MRSTRCWARRSMAALLIAALGWPSTTSAASGGAPNADAPPTEGDAKVEPSEKTDPGAKTEPSEKTDPEAKTEPDPAPKAEPTAPKAEPSPQDPAKNAAAEHWREGKRHYENGRYAEAAIEFERSHAAVPHAVTLYSIGLAYERAGKPVEATRAFRRYLALPDCAERPDDAPRNDCTEKRSDAEQALEELRPLVGELALSFGEGVRLREVRVAGRVVPLDDFPLLLLPGTVDVEVFGLRPDERRIRAVPVVGGETVTFYVAPFESEPVPRPVVDPGRTPTDDTLRLERRRRALETTFWVGTGLTASSAIALAITGGLARYHYGRFAAEKCPEQCWEKNPDGSPKLDAMGNIVYLDRPYPLDHRREFERYKPVATALVGVTVGLAVATALVGTFAFRKAPRGRQSSEADVRARVGVGASGLVVRW